jgi:transposase
VGHREEAEKFYRDLALRGAKIRVGMEASGHARWFERLLSELQFELWIGDAAEIRTKRVRKQKTDRQLEERFPRGSGCRAGKTAIYGNCCGTDTACAGALP